MINEASDGKKRRKGKMRRGLDGRKSLGQIRRDGWDAEPFSKAASTSR